MKLLSVVTYTVDTCQHYGNLWCMVIFAVCVYVDIQCAWYDRVEQLLNYNEGEVYYSVREDGS